MPSRNSTDDVGQAFLDALIEHGFPAVMAHGIVESLEDVIDQIVDRRAASALAEVFQKLDGTPAALALRRVLVGSNESRRQEARRIGCSPNALRKSEAQIRRRLGMQVPTRDTVEIKNV